MRPSAPRRNILWSYADVAACSAMSGFGETYFSAFALAVGLSGVAAGLVGTLPMLAAGLVQLAAPLGPRLCRSYRRWVVGCVILQGLAFLPLAAACAQGSMSATGVFGVVTLYYLAGMGGGAAWSTWIDGIVPRRVFGGFLATRARITQAASFAAFLGGGALLNYADAGGKALWAFLALFAGAGVARLISAVALSRHSDLTWAERPATVVPLRAIATRFLAPGKGQFLLFLLAYQVAVNIGSPFFPSFFLGVMKFSYAQYASMIGASYLAKIAFYPLISRVVRRVGAYRALWVSGLCIAPMPLFWFLTPQVEIICLVQVVAGVLWGTFELASTVLQFGRIDAGERLAILTVYTALGAAAVALGSVIGGLALARWGEDVGYGVIFALSAGTRLCSLGALIGWSGRRLRRRRIVRVPVEHLLETERLAS